MVSFHIEKALNKLDNDTNIQFNSGRRQQRVEQAGGPPRSSPAGSHSNVFSVDGAAESLVKATMNVFRHVEKRYIQCL